MTFGNAIELMKSGSKVAREGWDGLHHKQICLQMIGSL